MTPEELIRENELAAYLAEYDGGDKYAISMRQEYGEPRYLFRVGGVGCMPMGDVSAIKAKAKNGKSTLITAFIAAAICGRCGHIECVADAPTILYFDTEQNPHNTARNIRAALRMSGQDPHDDIPRLWVYNIRTMPKDERVKYIEQKMFDHGPAIVFIDGLRDLLNDFNDIAESGELIETVTRWSTEYEANICNVLHENKSKEDTNMRGHLGTELVNKCADVWQVTKDAKDKTRFTVEQTESRNAPVDDFAMKREDDGTITIDPGAVRTTVYDTAAFEAIFQDHGSRRYNDLKTEYAELTSVVERTARRHIDAALADGFIDRNNGLYYIKRSEENEDKGN